jgi:hypothetical protein
VTYDRGMRTIAIVVVCLAACGNKSSEHANPKGAKVIDWSASTSTRDAFKTATFENKSTRDDVIEVKTCADTVKLKLHLELATAKYTEAGTAMSIGSITALTATVEDGKGFEFSKGACDGPNYELTAPGTMPGFTILDCHLHAEKPNNSCAPMFQLKVDGTLIAN